MPLVQWPSRAKESEVSESYTVPENVWRDDVLVFAVNEVIPLEVAKANGLVGKAKPENKMAEAPKARTTRTRKSD